MLVSAVTLLGASGDKYSLVEFDNIINGVIAVSDRSDSSDAMPSIGLREGVCFDGCR